uniref:Uncharacterized protein n=1 Tax=Glycine max TaxID=3847 RepID=C6TM37_SOYBN|nr:unknown [Glycine max]
MSSAVLGQKILLLQNLQRLTKEASLFRFPLTEVHSFTSNFHFLHILASYMQTANIAMFPNIHMFCIRV